MASTYLSQFRIFVRSRVRPIGTFTYFVTRKNDPDWTKTTAEYFFTREEALAAGRTALDAMLELGGSSKG
jgi:hypothetical protein